MKTQLIAFILLCGFCLTAFAADPTAKEVRDVLRVSVEYYHGTVAQPGWAQQYNDRMQPIWARKFEPPGISGHETQDVVKTLLLISHKTGDQKYLKPIAPALGQLEQSVLSNGTLARFYELHTNRPLYMKRRGKDYQLTYSDTDLPKHYGFQVQSHVHSLKKQFQNVRSGKHPWDSVSVTELSKRAREIVGTLDDKGRWVSVYDGTRLVGQPKFDIGQRYLSSQVFSDHVCQLSEYLISVSKN